MSDKNWPQLVNSFWLNYIFYLQHKKEKEITVASIQQFNFEVELEKRYPLCR